MDESEKRRQILAIHRRTDLTPAEKNQAISSINSSLPPPSCYPDGIRVEVSCEHYPTKKCSNFFFSCCNSHFSCHRCHNLTRGDHPYTISEISCLECSTKQEPKAICSNCDTQFEQSFCEICKLWTSKEIFHCISCGICRVGKKENFTHCDFCDMCFGGTGDGHDCVRDRGEGSSLTSFKDAVCPFCLESCFSSQQTSTKLNCSHFAHGRCQEKAWSRGDFRCPLCRKSSLPQENLLAMWREMRNNIQFQPMFLCPIFEGSFYQSPFGIFTPMETISNTISVVTRTEDVENTLVKGKLGSWQLAGGNSATATLRRGDLKPMAMYKCNDCLHTGGALYHYVGVECQNCHGFNVNIVERSRFV